MNKSAKRMGSLALSAMMALSIIGSNGAVFAVSADEALKNPETDAMVFATQALDGNFNPFFATSGTDTEVIAQTQISMLTADTNGSPVCGEEWPTVALDYKETMKDASGKEVTDGAQAAYTDYEFIIKKGIQFSDGVELTMKDVLFNLYVYLDPAYMGSSTIYSTDIVGLKAYRAQDDTVEDDSEGATGNFYVKAEQRVANMISYAEGDIESTEQIEADIKLTYKLFREELESDWNVYAGTQEAYKEEYRFTEDWEIYYWNEGIVKPWTEKNENGVPVPKKDENGKYLTSLDKDDDALREAIEDAKKDEAAIKAYTDKGVSKELAVEYVVRDFAIQTVYETYANEYNLWSILTQWATAGNIRDEFAAEAKSDYFASLTQGGNLRVKSISGITVGTTEKDYDGKALDGTHDVLKIRINKVDPKAIWNFSFTVSPVHYYAGETYKEKINYTDPEKYYFGVEFANKDFFDDVLKDADKSGLPVGAGVYRATNSAGTDKVDRTSFYNNNNVYFKRNDYFYTVGSGLNNAKIKYMTFTVVPSDQIINYLSTGRIHFGEPNAKQSNVDEIGKYKHLGYAMYDTNGYGYVGVNPKYVPDIEVRQAIMKAMDTASIVKNYYTTALAKVITRPMSTTLKDYYPNAKTHEKVTYTTKVDDIRALVESAGRNGGNTWTLKNGKYYNQDGDALKITFTIAGDTKDHPAYAMFEDAAKILNDAGFDITVITSPNALKSLATGTLEVWAAAWSSPLDPDMYQVYHKDSTATSVKNWGYPTIFADSTGQFADEQTIINDLAELIEAGRETINKNVRKDIYAQALDKVMELCVELPTYQRKDLVVYNKNVINVKTLNTKDASHMNGVTDRLWEIEFADGTSAGGGSSTGLIIGIVVGAVVVLGGAGAFVFLKLRKKPQAYVLDESADNAEETKDDSSDESNN